jgi:hypothetical protein
MHKLLFASTGFTGCLAPRPVVMYMIGGSPILWIFSELLFSFKGVFDKREFRIQNPEFRSGEGDRRKEIGDRIQGIGDRR